MAESIWFTASQIERLGFICPKCGTEVVLEFRENTLAPRACPNPNCDAQPPQPSFDNWRQIVNNMKSSKDAHYFRLYFKESE